MSRFVERAASEVEPGARVLDAGAGEGPYAALFSHARYVPVDDGRGDDRWDYSRVAVAGDLLRLPFGDGSFDVVLSTETLEHLTEPGALLVEAARVLRPGGRLYLTAPQAFKEHQQPHDYFRFTRYGLRHLLERAGLEPVQVEPEGGYFRFLGDKIQPAHRYLFQKDRHLIWKILFLPFHPFSMLFFTVFLPALCACLDPLDKRRIHTTGYLVIARRPETQG